MLRNIHLHIVTTALASSALLLIGTTFSSASGAQDSNERKALFEKRCGGCHALDRDKEGPRLGGVYGRTAGKVDSFRDRSSFAKGEGVPPAAGTRNTNR